MAFKETDYDGLEVIVFCLIAIAALCMILQGLNFVNNKFFDGQLDCSKCHSVEFHETKKNVQYMINKKYKNPTKWLN